MMDAHYRLRYFFEAGAGTCLWADDPGTEARYGLAVDIHMLPVRPNTRVLCDHATAWFDTHLDWDDPAGPSVWSDDEAARFRATAARLLEALRADLEPAFEIADAWTGR
jgi:hypothetical protein